MPSTVRGFAPLARADARALVLGSMPGAISLAVSEYYAHPRNAFWDLQGELFGAGREHAYATRTRRLCDAGVALWDVLAACERRGSADAAILTSSEQANDFASFLAAHPRIEQIFFNGSKAEHAWRRLVAPQLAAAGVRRIPCTRLPSTSAAHAAASRAQKLAAWRVLARAVSASGTRR